MCGIFASVSRGAKKPSTSHLKVKLKSRGPDHFGVIELQAHSQAEENISLIFNSTVLSLRGGHVVEQPLTSDLTGSVLCWNGEAWKIGQEALSGNDGEAILGLLTSTTSKLSRVESISAVIDDCRDIAGPFAFVYFDKIHNVVYYGRDRLGRRSLLYSAEASTRSIAFSSTSDPSDKNWDEVEADGLYALAVSEPLTSLEITSTNGHLVHNLPFPVYRFPWVLDNASGNEIPKISLGRLNQSLPPESYSLDFTSSSMSRLEHYLYESLKLRVLNIPDPPSQQGTHRTKLAILFSGGLDCTLLARIAHDLLPADEEVDLLNVAFENPRVVQAAKNLTNKHHLNDLNDYPGVFEKSSDALIYETCPDRMTGWKSFNELQKVCPARKWNFVADIDKIPQLYTTPARVLLSGLGADELFGGYTRHSTAFSRGGYRGLIDELELDVNRLGKRNLGRDDRVISNWGREARYPYLDEDLMQWAISCPVWQKCGFGLHGTDPATGGVETPELEPGKRVLRLLAWKLGMHNVASEKKRAIQFGARTAKMETGRTKGTSLILN